MDEKRQKDLLDSVHEARGDVLLLRQCILHIMEKGSCSQLELDTLWRLSDYLNQHLWEIHTLVQRME